MKTKQDPVQAAQLRFFISTEKLIEAAEQTKRDREELFRLLREQELHQREAAPCQ